MVPALSEDTVSFVRHMTRDDIIFGRKPVMEMLEKGIKPDKILLQSGVEPAFGSRVRALAKALDVQVQTVPWQKLKSVTRAQHQGIIAFKAWVTYQRVHDVVHHLFEQGLDPLLVMLDHITDVRNLGAIARSAEVLGAHGIILPSSGSASVNGEAVKASAGALINLAVCRERSLTQTLEDLHALGLRSFAADMHGEKLLHDTDMRGPAVLILGAEDRGISPQLADLVHERFRIPQAGQTDSLNVSVAGGIVLYHALICRTG